MKPLKLLAFVSLQCLLIGQSRSTDLCGEFGSAKKRCDYGCCGTNNDECCDENKYQPTKDGQIVCGKKNSFGAETCDADVGCCGLDGETCCTWIEANLGLFIFLVILIGFLFVCGPFIICGCFGVGICVCLSRGNAKPRPQQAQQPYPGNQPNQPYQPYPGQPPQGYQPNQPYPGQPQPTSPRENYTFTGEMKKSIVG